MKDADRIVKFILLALIAVCVAGVLLSVMAPAAKKPAGQTAGANAARSAAPSGAANSSGAGNSSRGVSAESSAITIEAVKLVPQKITKQIKINGDVSCRSEISLYADTSGKLVRYETGVGTDVAKGDIIALIDPSKPGSSYTVSPVRSTINGTIISLQHTAGETVSASSPVATIGVLDDLEIITYVPEKYIAVLKKGLTAQISLVPFPGAIFSAVVTQVSPVVDTASRTVEIRLDVKDALKKLKPGMFAVITLVTENANGVMVVPKTAVRTYNNSLVVYVVDSGNKAKRIVVTTGLSNDASIQLVTGVKFGDQVIVSGSVSDGTLVRQTAETTPAETTLSESGI